MFTTEKKLESICLCDYCNSYLSNESNCCSRKSSNFIFAADVNSCIYYFFKYIFIVLCV